MTFKANFQERYIDAGGYPTLEFMKLLQEFEAQTTASDTGARAASLELSFDSAPQNGYVYEAPQPYELTIGQDDVFVFQSDLGVRPDRQQVYRYFDGDTEVFQAVFSPSGASLQFANAPYTTTADTKRLTGPDNTDPEHTVFSIIVRGQIVSELNA